MRTPALHHSFDPCALSRARQRAKWQFVIGSAILLEREAPYIVCLAMGNRRHRDAILTDIARIRLRYEASVERGDIDGARQVRSTLSDMLAELGRENPDLEESMRREMKFPEFQPPI